MNPTCPGAERGSWLYECRVVHERLAPVRHRFSYGLFYLCVDLDELPELGRGIPFLSVNRANLLSLHEDDHLPADLPLHNPSAPAASYPKSDDTPAGARPPLRERVRLACAREGLDPGPDARVRLVTLPRLLGYQFNPVSFFFCCDAQGRPVCALAVVTNTFREVKTWVIPASSAGRGVVFRLRAPKHFYVSPFSPLDFCFDFTLHQPGDRLAVRIDDHDGDRRVLHTTLTGTRAPLGAARLAWLLLRYPLVGLRVIGLIHWQALRLWLRRVPWFAKADQPGLQRDLNHPHSSLSSPSES